MDFAKYREVTIQIMNIFGIYLVWIVLHYFAAHLYTKFCVPATILGFIAAPFIATSPHCQALRWTVYNGGNSIAAMWIVLGTWLLQYLIPIRAFTAQN